MSNLILFKEIDFVRDSPLVLDNLVVHPTLLHIGLKRINMDVCKIMLSSCFSLGGVTFNGITCWHDLKKDMLDWGLEINLLKNYFNHTMFMKQVMAMYHCQKCYQILKEFLEKNA